MRSAASTSSPPICITEYDQRALREIHAWKKPEIGWFDEH
jgi:hypothetical protein